MRVSALFLVLAGFASGGESLTCQLRMLYDQPRVRIQMTGADVLEGTLDCEERLSFRLAFKEGDLWTASGISQDSATTLVINGRNDRKSEDSPLNGATLDLRRTAKGGFEAVSQPESDDLGKLLALAALAVSLKENVGPMSLSAESAAALFDLGATRNGAGQLELGVADGDTAGVRATWSGEVRDRQGEWVKTKLSAEGTTRQSAKGVILELKGEVGMEHTILLVDERRPYEVKGPITVRVEFGF